MNNVRPSSTAIKAALTQLLKQKSKQIEKGFVMLREHYNAEEFALSAEDLALSAGMRTYGAANSHYGAFAHRLCKILGYEPPEAGSDNDTRWTYVLATYPGRTNSKGHGMWILRPEVAQALEELALVQKRAHLSPMDDIEAKKPYLDTLSEKDRAAMIRARLGQGDFRKGLIGFWGACAITGCKTTELLVASHIKPWRECDVFEAKDICNGLLLTPNLDKAFDRGYISFESTGEVVISKKLSVQDACTLGITSEMRLKKDLIPEQQMYMRYHYSHILIR
jgi:hypothetical protein